MAQNRAIGKPEMREMLLLLSVVIPFYRVEKYIGACLAALEGLEECEALLVDDCGDDQSADIAQAYCAAQGVLLRLSPGAFVASYDKAAGR